MIKINDTYGIDVDSRCFITGKIGLDKKKNKPILLNPRYFTTMSAAINDIADREVKEQLSGVDCSLMDAIHIMETLYDAFSKKLNSI